MECGYFSVKLVYTGSPSRCDFKVHKSYCKTCGADIKKIIEDIEDECSD